MRNNLSGGYSTAIQLLKPLLLTGLQAACLTKYFIDRRNLGIKKLNELKKLKQLKKLKKLKELKGESAPKTWMLNP